MMTHDIMPTVTIAGPASTESVQCCVVPHAHACLADARTDVRAPPFLMCIHVVPLIDWTSLRLEIFAGSWELTVLVRSTRPIRGRVLGSFLEICMGAGMPARCPGPLRLPRFVPAPVLCHRGPDGQRGGVAPIARAEPRSAATTPQGGAAWAVQPLDICAAPSPTSSFMRLEPCQVPGTMPNGDLPLAIDRDPPGGDRRPRFHLHARATRWRLSAPACNGLTCGSASGGASSQKGGRRTRGEEPRGAGSGLSPSSVLLPARSGEREMPVAPGRKVAGGVGVAELLAASTSAATSTPPPRVMERTRASGVVVWEFAFASASAVTATLPGPGARPLEEEPCEVDVADLFFVATSAQTPTSRT